MIKHQGDWKDVGLTKTEFDLLALLEKLGRTVGKSQLLDLLSLDSDEHGIESHIRNIRKKLESDPASPSYIVTQWGLGYRFKE